MPHFALRSALDVRILPVPRRTCGPGALSALSSSIIPRADWKRVTCLGLQPLKRYVQRSCAPFVFAECLPHRRQRCASTLVEHEPRSQPAKDQMAGTERQDPVRTPSGR